MHRQSLCGALVATLALAAFGPLSACKKEGGASGASGDALAYIPKDSAIVMSVAINKARDSALFKKYQDKFLSEMPKELGKIKEICKLDVVNDINSFVAGIGANPEDESKQVFVISGNFDKAKVASCLKSAGKELGNKEMTAKDEGKLTVYSDGEKSMYFYWPNDKTLVINPAAAQGDKAALEALIGGDSVKDNSGVMDMVKKVESDATLWIAGEIPEAAAGQMGGLGGDPPKGVYVSVMADSGVSAKVGLVFADEKAAKQMSMMATMGITMAKDQAGPFKDVLESVKVDQEGSVLKISAKMTGEQVDGLAKMASSFGGF